MLNRIRARLKDGAAAPLPALGLWVNAVWASQQESWPREVLGTTDGTARQTFRFPRAHVPVLPGDTEESLTKRVLAREHVIYPRAVRWFVEGQLAIDNGLVRTTGRTEQHLIDERCQ